MSDHHPTLPPSSLDKKKHCALWVSGDVGQAAEDGSEDHAALASAARNDFEKLKALPPGRQSEVRWFLNLVVCQRDDRTFQVEERLDIYDADYNLVTFGTADILDATTIWDYKSGQYADHEAQMYCYALGLMQRFDTQQCRVVIGWGRRMKVDEYYVTRADAESYLFALFTQIKSDIAADSRHVGKWCGWCGLKLTCPKFTSAVGVVRQCIAGDLPVFDPAKLDEPEHLAAAVRFIRLFVNPWADALEKRAKAAAIAGTVLPGLELTTKQGLRQIEDLAQAFQLLALPQDEFLKCCNLILKNTEEVFSAHNTLTRARAKAEVARRLDPFTTRGASTLTLEIIEETTTQKE